MNFRKSILCATAALVSAFGVTAQENYYRLPMDIPLLLSANFAELRSGHFHSGIDIKTGGVEGHKIYAAADGYISRIGIVPGGYGRVLYIAHPNGTTTVYGHMKEFSADVEAYVKQERYRRRLHSLNLYPDKGMFPVKKGDFIGLSGNSGRSSGPHLHYEIRESAHQDPLNPIARGYVRPTDHIPPTVYNLYWITVDTLSGVPVHTRRLTVKPVRKAAGQYVTEAPLSLGGKGYFAVEYTDTKDGVTNKFGVYSISLTVDGKKVFGYVADRFPFSQTKYVNDVMAYDLHQKSSHDVMRLVRPVSNPLSMYRTGAGSGLLVFDGKSRVEIGLEDDCGNVSHISFEAVGRSSAYAAAVVPAGKQVARHDKDFTMTTEGLTVSIPKGTLYEPVFYNQFRTDAVKIDNQAIRVVSDFYVVGDTDVPMLSSYSMTIKCALPEQKRRYATIAKVSNGKVSCVGGQWRDGGVTATVSSFGTYCVVLDDTPPKTRSLFADGADLTGRKSFTVGISDDLSGVASFEATIDGKWIIFEQNVMKGTITHYFDNELLGNGHDHELVLTLKDGRGNVSETKRHFRY